MKSLKTMKLKALHVRPRALGHVGSDGVAHGEIPASELCSLKERVNLEWTKI